MKHVTKIFIVLSMMLSSTSVLAERLEVFRWQALDGKTAQLAGSLMEAAKLHEKSGASVGIFQMDVGGSGNTTFDYVLRWDSSEAWAKTKAYNSGEEFTAFFAKAGADPSGKLMMSLEGLNWDASVTAASFADDGPFRVFIWTPTQGRVGDVYQTFMEAKAIHEKLDQSERKRRRSHRALFPPRRRSRRQRRRGPPHDVIRLFFASSSRIVAVVRRSHPLSGSG